MSDNHQSTDAAPASRTPGRPAPAPREPGFLPIETNWFDRLFISVVIWVALSLFWFRFVEPLGASIWISNAIALALAALIIRKG